MRRILVGMAIVSMALSVPFLVRADDQKIADAIFSQIQEHMDAGRLKGFGIDLQVDKGVVELKGQVASAEQLDLILAAVAQANGVKDVINEVQLREVGTKSPARDVKSGTSSSESSPAFTVNPLDSLQEHILKPADEAIRSLEKKVAGALSASPVVSKPALETPGRTNPAGDVTRTTTTPTSPAVADQLIGETIVAKLREHMDAGRLKGLGLDLQVANGVVELKGKVASIEQLDLILAEVTQADGVKDVINEMQVQDSQVIHVSAVAPAAQVVTEGAEPTQVYVPFKGVEGQPAARLVTSQGVVAKPTASDTVRTIRAGDATRTAPAAQVVTEGAEPTQVHLTIKDVERQPVAGLVTSEGVTTKPVDEATVDTLRQRLAEAQRKLENALNPGSTPVAAGAVPTIPVGDGHRLRQGEDPLETIQDQVLGALIPKADVSDKQIAEDISTNLQAEKDAGVLKEFGLRMRVNQGIVWFTGQVTTAENRLAIGDIARKTLGVKEVVNELKLTAADESVDLAIGGTAPQRQRTMSDNDIAIMISGELKAKKKAGKLTNFSLQMTVKEGKVWLRGYVPSRKQRDMALAAAEGVAGVGAVVNEINIELPIARDIASLLPQALRSQSLQSGIPSLAQLPVAMAGAMVAAPAQLVGAAQGGGQVVPAQMASSPSGVARARYDQPQMPNYAWPTYAAHPNYGAVTYPKQYSPSAWPYIGPFYPYPQVPLGWRRVTLEWDDGWWFLDFSSRR